MIDFVNMRAPTNKVELNKHTTAQVMTHFSREYGFIKLGVTPGGGAMLGVFAHIVASAIPCGVRMLGIQQRDLDCQNPCDSETQVETLHFGFRGNIAYFNRSQSRTADNWTWPKTRLWLSLKTGF